MLSGYLFAGVMPAVRMRAFFVFSELEGLTSPPYKTGLTPGRQSVAGGAFRPLLVVSGIL